MPKESETAALSVACLTDQSPERTAAALRSVGSTAAEIVLGVAATQAANGLSAYEQLATRVVVLDDQPLELGLATVHDVCTGHWVLHLRGDEVVSPGLASSLPGLLGAGQAADQYAVPRRWLSADGAGWHDEAPWWPDWQVRLVRRASSAPDPRQREPFAVAPGRRHLADPIYTAAAAVRTRAEREQALLQDEVIRLGGPGTLRESSAQRWLPERFALRAPVPVPPEDRQVVESLLTPAAPGTSRRRWRLPIRGRRQDTSPPASPVAPTPPRATTGDDVQLEVLERSLRIAPGQRANVGVRVQNTSSETWTSGRPGEPTGHALSYHWHIGDQVIEGPRTLFPDAVRPGEDVTLPLLVEAPDVTGSAELRIRVVHETVRWLVGTAEVAVAIQPPPTVPDHREHRPGGPEIPRIIHRVWLGGRPLPDEYARYGQTWADHHPGWELRLWTDDDAPVAPGIERARSLAERADLTRYEVLRQYGGVYVDTDIECLRPIDDLLEGVVAFSGYEERGRLCNALIGCVPGHPAVTRLTELAAVTAGHGSYPQATATVFSTFVLEGFQDVTLFSPDRFYPELWDGRENAASTAPYTRHHWAKSWTAAPAEHAD